MQALTIGKAARRAGVGVETIRFYERRGLIEQPPKPPGAGFRSYSAETVRRIQFIRQAQQLGFLLSDIEELLSLRADPAADCGQVRAKAAAKVEEVERKIAELKQIRGALEDVIAACPGRGEIRTCTILDALDPVQRSESQKIVASYTRRHVPGLRSVARPFVRLEDEGCSDGPSRSSRTEDEPWENIGKHSSRLT